MDKTAVDINDGYKSIEFDQIIDGQKCHIEFTCNSPSEMALSELAKKIVEIYK